MTIKGYKITTRMTIMHNEVFSHTMDRTQIVEAQSMTEALEKSVIREPEETFVDEKLTIYAGQERIIDQECLGLRSFKQIKYYGDEPAS